MRRAPFAASCNVPPSGFQWDQSELRACRDEQTEKLFEDSSRGIRLIVYSTCTFLYARAQASPKAQTDLSQNCIRRRDQNYYIVADSNLRVICDNYQPLRRDYKSLSILKSEVDASCY